MRVWLVDDPTKTGTEGLAGLLRQLAEQSEGRLVLLGAGPAQAGQMAGLEGQQLDLLVVSESACPEDWDITTLLAAGVGLVVAGSPDRCERFLRWADLYPVWLLPARPEREALWLALLGSEAARRRHSAWKTEVAGLQQRLDDRIVVERGKGLLMKRLGIAEDEAYQRLRVLSREQRRPMRDIAQALLDTEPLLRPQGPEPHEENCGEA